MNHALSPIRKLIIISFALHTTSIFAVVLLIFLRGPLMSYFYGFAEEALILPSSVITAPIAATFILHCVLTALFLSAVQNEVDQLAKLKILSIISLAFVVIVLPFLLSAVTIITPFFHGRLGVDYLAAQSTLQFIISFGLIFRGLGLSALLMAASMSIYYCFLNKSQKENGEHHGKQEIDAAGRP